MSDGASLGHLRTQLVHMRNELVERLARRMDGSQLALLGSVGSALEAVDAMLRDDAEPMLRDDAEPPEVQ